MSRLESSPFGLCILAAVLFLACLSVDSARAQQVVRGLVVDGETGSPLPAANIRIEDTYTGTITNVDGEFALTVDSFPATIVFRYVGYRSRRYDLSSSGPFELTVAMEPAVVTLEEVIVTGEDPAIEIMRRVIARKQEMLSGLNSYKTDAYNRFTISNDTGIVSIIESFTEAYWKKQEGLRELNLSQRQTRNMAFDDLLPAAMFVANMYDDDIEIGGFNLRGVTHPDALNHYRYSLEDFVYLDDQLVYELSVEPSSSRKTGFKGLIRVLAEEYVLLEVNLSPGKAVYYPPPFEDVQTVIYQQFADFGDGYWLPSDLHSTTEIKIAFGPLFDFPRIRVDQLSRLSSYVPNAVVPDSLFDRDASEIVQGDTLLESSEIDAWLVPLSAREQEAYANIDSSLTMQEAFMPGGLLGRMAEIEMSAGNQDGADTTGAGVVLFNRRFIPNLAYNRVEGFRAGLDMRVQAGSAVRVSAIGGTAYQTARKKWAYKAGGGLEVGRNTVVGVDALYFNRVSHRQTPSVFSIAPTSLMSLFGHPDYFDYLSDKGFEVKGRLRHVMLGGIELSATLGSSEHSSVVRNTSYDLIGRDKLQRANPSINEGDLRSVRVALSINEPPTELPVGERKSLIVSVEHSDPSLMDSDFSYTRFSAMLDWRFKTFFRRRLIPQTLDFRVIAAVHDGTTPAQRLSTVDASNGIYTPYGAFRTAGDRAFEGDGAIAVFWEHNFRTAPFELIGAWGLARSGISFSIFGGHGRIETSEAVEDFLSFEPLASAGWYNEIGFSVGGLLGIFRLDVGKQIGGSNASVGVSVARLF